jgi:branched-chain amino acid transport system substrate-binding protein
VTQALRSRGITVVDTISFDERDDDLADDAQAVVDSGARVAVVLADGQDGVNFLSALDQVDNDVLTRVIVNDAMRNPASPQVIQGLDPDFRRRIHGVSPQAEPGEGESYEPSGFYAVNAVDCVNLLALAALQVESDAPRDIAGQMASVSAGGAPCASFAECAEQRANGFDFDYEGPSGVTELVVRQGDPRIGRFQEFIFDETGRDVTLDSFTVET